MPRFHVTGTVVGGKYLGEFEAATAEEAIDQALRSTAGHVSLCHQCAGECENAEIEQAVAEEIKPEGE